MGVKPPRPTRARRRRGSLSREQVVEAALELADEEGLQGLTMQSLAKRLDCGVMSLYVYLDGKEELLEAIVRRGLADLRLPPGVPSDTRGILEAWGRAMREVLLRHPSLPTVFLDRPVIGPGILRGLEQLLTRLEGSGVPAERGVHAVYAVLIYCTGSVAWEIPRTRRQPAAVYSAAWRREAAALPEGEIPHVLAALDEAGEVAGEAQFELGLHALVRGLV